MPSRERLSATVDTEALAAGRAAVEAGRAPSLSAWVNDALVRQAEHDARLIALEQLLAGYESAHGEITPEEIATATRNARARAVVVRPPELPARSRRDRGAGSGAS